MAVLIVAATIGVYRNGFGGVFFLDDHRTIVGNARIRHILPRGEEWYDTRPLVKFTFAVNYARGRLNPADYHATNLVLHAVTALLLFGFLRRTGERLRWKIDPWKNDILAGMASLLWAVHPLGSSAVMYVCQRFETMSALFIVGALYAHARWSGGGSRWWMGVTAVMCFMGVMSKETAMVAPILIVLYDYMVPGARVRSVPERLVSYGLAAGAGVMAVSGTNVMTSYVAGPASAGREVVSPANYLATQAGVILHYLKLSLFPVGLSIDYAWPFVERVRDAWVELAVVGGLAGVAIVMAAMRKAAGFAGVVFFAVLAPSSSVFPLMDAAFEHRMYLSLAAAVALAVYGCWYLVEKWCMASRRIETVWRAEIVALGVVALLLGAGTAVRNADFASEEVLWRRATERWPRNARAWEGLANALIAGGRLREAEATALGLKSMVERGGVGVNTQARARAAALLGRVYMAEGRAADAVRAYDAALSIRSNFTSVHYNRALALLATNDLAGALQGFRNALASDPEYVAAVAGIGFVEARTGSHESALRSYERVLKVWPEHLWVRRETAMLLAASPDQRVRNGERAIKMAAGVCEELEWGSWRALDAYAAACAECGRYREALSACNKAIGILERMISSDVDVASVESDPGDFAAGLPEAKDDMEKKRLLYQSCKPYRLEMKPFPVGKNGG